VSSFYVPDGDLFVATENTRGPWSSLHQHAGPPAALVGRGIEQAVPAGEGWQVVRITYELLRPIPIARLSLHVDEARVTKRTRLMNASLFADTSELVRAHALLIRQAEVPVPDVAPPVTLPPPPESLPENPFPFFQDAVGYHTAMQLRFSAGGFGQARSTAWMRMRIPLVAGEAPSQLARVLCAADSGNGITNVLDFKRFTYLNPDLTVTLHRLPEGEWVCLDAYTHPESNGIGLAQSRLYDRRGPLGHALQTLLLTHR
jgi:hypothetical protein